MRATEPPSARWLPLLFAAIYFAFGRSSPILFVDFFGFVEHADLLPGQWLDGFYPTGYPLLLRAAFELLGDYALAGTAISAVAAALVLRATYRIGRALGGSDRAGLAALLLVAVHPEMVYWSSLGATEVPFLACVAWAIVFLLEGGPRAAWRAGLCLGAGYLVRYTAVAPALAAIGWVLAKAERRPCVAPLLAGIVVASLPQWLPSWLLTDDPLWNYQAKNVWFGLHGHGDWDRYWERVPDAIPLAQVVREDGHRLPAHLASNLGHAALALLQSGTLPLALAGAVLAVGLRHRLPGAGVVVATAAATVVVTAIAFVRLRLLFFPAMALLWLAAPLLAGGKQSRLGRWLFAAAIVGFVVANGYRAPRWHPRVAAYGRVAAVLRAAGMAHPVAVASLTSADGDFFYDARDRRKRPFLPIPLPRDDLTTLRTTLAAHGKRFLVLESAVRFVYPRVGRLLDAEPPPAGFRRLGHWRLPARAGWPSHEVAVYEVAGEF